MSVQFRIDHSPDSFSTRVVHGSDDVNHYTQAVVVHTPADVVREEFEALVTATRGLMLQGEFAAQDGTIIVGMDHSRIGGLKIPQGGGAWDTLLDAYKINAAAYNQALAYLTAAASGHHLWQVAGWARNEDETLEILDRTIDRLTELSEYGRDVSVVDVPEGTLI